MFDQDQDLVTGCKSQAEQRIACDAPPVLTDNVAIDGFGDGGVGELVGQAGRQVRREHIVCTQGVGNEFPEQIVILRLH